MLLSNLRLLNFKNYSNCTFDFNPGLNFIYGDNGNGKTNILEAISFLCYTKSFLQSSESDCVKYGEDGLDVSGVFLSPLDTKNKVVFSFSKPDSKKAITLNDESIGRQSLFFGKIPLVVLSPGDIRLTSGSPLERRRSFDILISQISRLYFDDLRNYSRVVKQKNTLLRENLTQRKYGEKQLTDMLRLWNDELVEYGVKIILKRYEVLHEFRKYIEESFKKIVGNSYDPILVYESEAADSEEINQNRLEEKFREQLDQKYILELKRGVSMMGPHRDNYSFLMRKNGEVFDIKNFASQGEHKTFIVALRLSEYKFLKDKLEGSGSGNPILLLDDVFSELDSNRINKISGILPEFSQVFITTTVKEYINLLKDFYTEENISVFHIVNGAAETAN